MLLLLLNEKKSRLIDEASKVNNKKVCVKGFHIQFSNTKSVGFYEQTISVWSFVCSDLTILHLNVHVRDK